MTKEKYSEKRDRIRLGKGMAENRQYKSSLFQHLFTRKKEDALSLYNAVNGSNYDNPEDLEFITLENVLFMKMKNDVSFIFDRTLNLYEHQSTYNPNMPLRGLFYFADIYRKILVRPEALYSTRKLFIPNPKYVVFYNGSDNKMEEEQRILRLSDSFEKKEESGDFEWTATMININVGKNKEIKERCKLLNDYSVFVAKVRENSCSMNTKDAIIKATEDCLKQDVLTDFLTENRKEVAEMFWDEMDEEVIKEIMREDYMEEGREEGRKIGIEEGREEGRAEERANTERERKRADEAEEKLEKLKARLAAMGISAEEITQ